MSVALLLIFLGLMALGVPIAISLGAASVIVLITMGNMPLTMVVQLMYTSMNSFVMVAVPLFILAGSLMDEGGIADKIYDLAEACVDGRGTGGRGAEFEKVTYLKLGELEARDQVETALYLGTLQTLF